MKKKFFILLVLVTGISVIGVYTCRKDAREEVFNVNVQTEQGVKDELIVAVFIEHIRKAVEEYYVQNLSQEVTVYNYETDILQIEKSEGDVILIKFGVTPQTGAHNPVGYDEIVYAIDSGGNKKLVEYRHMKK